MWVFECAHAFVYKPLSLCFLRLAVIGARGRADFDEASRGEASECVRCVTARSRYRFEPVVEKQSIFSGAAVVFFCPVRGRGKPSGYGTEGFLRFEGRSAHEVGLGENGTLGEIKSLVEFE